MQTKFYSVEEYNKALSTMANNEVPSSLYYKEVKPEYQGKDVYLYISDINFKNSSLNIANVQNVVNPPKLHLFVTNCNFDGGTAGYKQIYITNAQELNIDNCTFINNTVSDYGVDVNLCSIQGAIIIIKNSVFDNVGIKSAIKISARKGATDHPTDITVTTPATVDIVSISKCTFQNNVTDYTIGTTPKGEDTEPNTTSGSYTVKLSGNLTQMIIKEPYTYKKDETVEPIIIPSEMFMIKNDTESISEVITMKLTSNQVEALNNMNVAAQKAQLGTYLKANLEKGDGSYELPSATTSELGGVKQSANQAHSSADSVANLVNDFNSLIDKLIASGIMASK